MSNEQVRTADHPLQKVAVIVPCYNEEAIIGESVARVRAKIAALASAGRIDAGSCIIAVDDGSIDDSWSIIESIADGTVDWDLRNCDFLILQSRF